MLKILMTSIMLCCMLLVNAQRMSSTTRQITVKSMADSAVLAGASVTWKEKNITRLTDESGKITLSADSGNQHFVVTYAGHTRATFEISFDQTDSTAIDWYLGIAAGESEEEEEVVVRATRTSRTIANTPTRIEVISGEELAEKGNMKPGDIRMLLSETTGIQTQQTSATSYNAGIRIQGLDGRYTQMLKDGYPMYAGFAGGLSILQIAPLDLSQVEVIKGSSSTLYGGGAIAGLVNLVSKTPGEERELSFITNATSAAGLDLSGFYSERYGKTGMTIFAARNSTRAYDPADIGLSAIPKATRYTINPRLFVYGKKTTADIGVSFITEDRTGGSMDYIKNGNNGYFEKNNSNRITATGAVRHKLDERTAVQLKSSYSLFDRKITIPSYQFDATQQQSFTELTWDKTLSSSEWIIGANLVTDDLAEKQINLQPVRDYHY
ncbi:MAG: TonB-dependent receptor, partial [Sphingobacteriales bacterium]